MLASIAPWLRRCRLALAVSIAAVILTPGRAFSGRIDGIRDGPQSVTMCANCSESVPCAQVNDYRITLSADIDPSASNPAARFTVRLTDRLAQPVTDAAVTLVLPSTDRSAPRQVVRLTGGRNGLYGAAVTLKSDPLRDPVKVNVFVTTAKGDRVKQRFVLASLVCRHSRG